jgi:hypothetical protein
MNVAEAICDPVLYAAFFRGPTWAAWRAVLKAAFAVRLSVEERALFRAVAERDPPKRQVRELWCVVGRRGGKTSISSVVLAHSAGKYDAKVYDLRPGEVPLVACMACDRTQASSVFKYVRGFYDKVPLLAGLRTESDRRESFELGNGVEISITTNSVAAPRGRTILAACLDEVAFYRSDDDSANPDTEVYNALTPGMATIDDSILCGISTPYAPRGLLYDKWSRYYGREDPEVLVVRGPTQVFNPRISRAWLERKYEEDPVSAAAEYGAEWRQPANSFLDEALVRAATDANVSVRCRSHGVTYRAFVDVSGGRKDSSTLAIAHKESGGLVVLDYLYEARPGRDGNNPLTVIETMAATLKEWGINEIRGDDYAANFPKMTFAQHGIRLLESRYTSDDPKMNRSVLYLEALPLFSASRARLLDSPRLREQLTSLVRRPGTDGRDKVDHPRGMHDDAANAVCGALVMASGKRRPIGELITPAHLAALSAPRVFFGTGDQP